MTKHNITEKIAEQFELTKKSAGEITDAVFDLIAEGLKEEGKVVISGFGTFSVKDRAGRIGRNPKTGEPVEIAATKVPAFKAGKELKTLIK